MAANEVVKRNISGMQVIKTIQVLIDNNFTMSELVETLNKSEKEPIFNNNVISKYINTCRYCGFTIPKENNRYFVAKIPFGLSLSEKDVDLLENLQEIAKKILPTKSNRLFDKLITKLSRYSNKYITRYEVKNIDFIIEAFYKAIRQKRKILLFFKTKTNMECIPIDIIEKNGNKIFRVFDGLSERQISVERVLNLEITGKNFKKEEQVVTYKLYGALASRYTLREHEEIEVNNLPDHIVIVNKGEDKEELFSRLLRYDSLCEIIKPEIYREEMKAIIKEMLSNYGEK